MPAVLSAIAKDYWQCCEYSGDWLQPNEEEEEEMEMQEFCQVMSLCVAEMWSVDLTWKGAAMMKQTFLVHHIL